MSFIIPKFTIREAYAIISLFVLLAGCGGASGKKEAGAAFREIEDQYRSDLTACISFLDAVKQSQRPEQVQQHYLQARRCFKYAEPVLAFADPENYRYLNQPNILKVEEEDFTDIKIKEPSGFQVLEELVYADSIDWNETYRHADLTANRLRFIRKNISLKNYKPHHFLWLLRNSISRVALTGITGFDSPVLENSLQESAWVYHRLKKYLSLFKKDFQDPDLYEAWNQQIAQTMGRLKGDFNEFDRYAFIREQTHAQLALWVKTKNDWQVEFPFTLALTHEATTLFSNTTFNTGHFTDLKSENSTADRVRLGKMLFHDPSLSSSGKMSCASCHQEALAFTDGKKISEGQLRNSPTLSYAGLQQGFFWDKRSGSLEGQIVDVVNNQTEFHSSLAVMAEAVQQQPHYQQQFSGAYQGGHHRRGHSPCHCQLHQEPGALQLQVRQEHQGRGAKPCCQRNKRV